MEARAHTMSTNRITLVELIDICATMSAINTALFVRLGHWVRNGCADEELHPSDRRRLAQACHRHGWHADLWAERMPAVDEHPAVAQPPWEAPTLPSQYPAVLGTLLGELRHLTERVDRHLDPATLRVITLVEADLHDMRSRLVKPHF